jgi:Iron-containing redox enzyme
MKARMSSDTPALQSMYWPIVEPFDPSQLEDLLAAAGQPGLPEIHRKLAGLYAYSFGYRDSPLFQNANSDLEARLTALRFQLEDAMLGSAPLDQARKALVSTSQKELYHLLGDLVESNPAVHHRIFDFCEKNATWTALQAVARNEVCRNEVVDDEVSLMFPGVTGSAKAALALNFADEMGHGDLKKQHTYWLRELLAANNDVEGFVDYRRTRNWYLLIPSNVFNSLLLRPGYRWAAFGHFLVTETWVAPHFQKLISGFERAGYNRELKYFTAHEKIDRLHGAELLEALRHQAPALTAREVHLVEWGARLAVAAGTQYFDHFLAELRNL